MKQLWVLLSLGGVEHRPFDKLRTGITYLPMRAGFMFLVAILDWYSRYVWSFALSNTLDTVFCLEALEEAIQDLRRFPGCQLPLALLVVYFI